MGLQLKLVEATAQVMELAVQVTGLILAIPAPHKVERVLYLLPQLTLTQLVITRLAHTVL
jgi:hypothetical protein